ncbi:MAG: O-antigen ligase family protein [Anaerolineae bacterium]
MLSSPPRIRGTVARLSAPLLGALRLPLPATGEWCWLLAAAAVPLACNPWGSSAFELPKAVLLRLLVLALVVMALRERVSGSGRRASDGPASGGLLHWAAAAYLAAIILATVTSWEPRVSLLGSLARQQGLLTQGCYVFLFLLTAAALRRPEQIGRLWRTLVWASAPVVIYGLAQALGVDPLGWRSDGTSPVVSTLGRSNFVGSYLVLAMPLTAGLALVGGRRWPKSLLLLLAGQAACLAATQARGAWVGLTAAAAVFAIGFLPGRRHRLLALGATGTLALIGGLALAVKLPSAAGSVAARLTIWRASLQLVAGRPLLGYGPEAMQSAFYAVFPPELVYYQGRGIVVDRAHNLWLDQALSTGIVGLAALALLLAVVVYTAWRGYASAGSRDRRVTWLALLAAVVGHVVEQQFSFELTATGTVFWLTLAMISALARLPRDGVEPPAPSAASGASFVWLPPTLAALLLAVLTVALPLAADTFGGLAGEATASLGQRLRRAALAARLWPVESQYRLRLGVLLAEAADRQGADREMAAAVALRPADPALRLAQGGVYAGYPQDAARLTLAEAAYRQALSLSPNLATAHVALGQLLAAEGRLEEASAAFSRAVALDATDYYAYEQLAAVYAAAGQTGPAEQARGDAAYWRARTAPQTASLAR